MVPHFGLDAKKLHNEVMH